MKKLILLPETAFAGHSTVDGSNKIWAACLAREQECIDAPHSAPDASTEVVYLCVYGAYGARLRVEPPQRLSLAQAQALWQKKCREKTGKGYQPISFAPYLSSFVYPDGVALVSADESAEAVAEDDTALGVLTTHQAAISVPALPATFRHAATSVKAITWEQLQAKLGNPAYGLSEKVNGERCLLEFDGRQLVAYNRKGQRVSAPPQGALPLVQAGVPFVLDGERLPGAPTERFVAFDVLEWNGKSLCKHPYHQRMLTLIQEMKQANLLNAPLWTPTTRQALANSLAPDLAILATVHDGEGKDHLLGELLETGGEGVIVRKLAAPSDESPLKYKFQADLDAFTFAIEPGVAGGSLKLGLIRPSDQAVIAIGHVRAGLNADDLRTVQSLLDQGQFPVFPVHYLPARTIGFHLVEPHTSIRLLRTDKMASECTTDQFGLEKVALLAQAKSVPGIIVR